MATAEDRIGILEMRVDRLETWAGPGQVESLAIGLRAVRADVSAVRRVQTQHSTMLAGLISDVSGLKPDVATLTSDVSGLKSDVAILTADVSELKSDVAGLKSDVAALKSDVAILTADVSELKLGVAEILRRLPSLPAS